MQLIKKFQAEYLAYSPINFITKFSEGSNQVTIYMSHAHTLTHPINLYCHLFISMTQSEYIYIIVWRTYISN